MERLSCSEKDAVILCDNLKKIDSTLVPVLHRWIDTGDGADATTYRGYSIDTLVETGSSFFAALGTDSFRMPFSYFAPISSGRTALPT